MAEKRQKVRICVVPDIRGWYLVIVMWLFFILKADGPMERRFYGLSFILFLACAALWLLHKKIIAGPGGLVIYRLWNEPVRVRYVQISKVEVIFLSRGTNMYFYKDNECFESCTSNYKNFDVLLKFLMQSIPEKVELNRSGF